MRKTDLVVANCHQLITCAGRVPKTKRELKDVGLIEKAWIASYQGRITFIGQESEFKKEVILTEESITIDATGMTCLPGFVDAHNHLPFAGTREDEFVLRLQGLTYQEIASRGMGILTTVRATREASKEDLVSLCLSRLDQMLLYGTTTSEAKSGYGLNKEDEIKQLEVIKELNSIHPIDLVPTFLGAHDIPPEYKGNKKKYIDFLIREVMPEIKKNNLAEFFDAFCEEGVYSVKETAKLISAAKKFGLKIKLHADEFSSLGGTELAVAENAVSADHLIYISEEGIKKIARSKTAAIILPVVPFFLMLNKVPPVREMINQGVTIALATDFNPGSSMTESMLFALQMAVFKLKMEIEEAINAATINAAYALDRHSRVGSLEIGKKMDLIIANIPNYIHLIYHLGINPIKYVVKNGQIVARNGRIVRKE